MLSEVQDCVDTEFLSDGRLCHFGTLLTNQEVAKIVLLGDPNGPVSQSPEAVTCHRHSSVFGRNTSQSALNARIRDRPIPPVTYEQCPQSCTGSRLLRLWSVVHVSKSLALRVVRTVGGQA